MSVTLLEDGSLDKNIEKYIMIAAGNELPRLIKTLCYLALKCFYTIWRLLHPPPKQHRLEAERRELGEGTPLCRALPPSRTHYQHLKMLMPLETGILLLPLSLQGSAGVILTTCGRE